MKKDNGYVNIIIYVLVIAPLLAENIISTIFGETISKGLSILACCIILIVIVTMKNGKIKVNKFLITMLILIILHSVITFLLAPKNLTITTANSLITPSGLIG